MPLKILELREFTEQELVENYNLKDFHTLVIGNGSMPLTILENVVYDFITS